MRTLAELTSLYAEIEAESEVLWKRDWAPRFEKASTKEEYFQLVDELKQSAGVMWTDDLPSLYSVHIIFALDAVRQKHT